MKTANEATTGQPVDGQADTAAAVLLLNEIAQTLHGVVSHLAATWERPNERPNLDALRWAGVMADQALASLGAPCTLGGAAEWRKTTEASHV